MPDPVITPANSVESHISPAGSEPTAKARRTGHLVNTGYTTLRYTTDSEGNVSDYSDTGGIDSEERRQQVADIVGGDRADIADQSADSPLPPDPYKYSRVGSEPLFYGAGNPNNEVESPGGTLTALGLARAADRGWQLADVPGATNEQGMEGSALDQGALAASGTTSLDIDEPGVETKARGPVDTTDVPIDVGKSGASGVDRFASFQSELAKARSLPMDERAEALSSLAEQYPNLQVMPEGSKESAAAAAFLSGEIEGVNEWNSAQAAKTQAVNALNATIAQANAIKDPLARSAFLESNAGQFAGLTVKHGGKEVSGEAVLASAAKTTRDNHEADWGEHYDDRAPYTSVQTISAASPSDEDQGDEIGGQGFGYQTGALEDPQARRARMEANREADAGEEVDNYHPYSVQLSYKQDTGKQKRPMMRRMFMTRSRSRSRRRRRPPSRTPSLSPAGAASSSPTADRPTVSTRSLSPRTRSRTPGKPTR